MFSLVCYLKMSNKKWKLTCGLGGTGRPGSCASRSDRASGSKTPEVAAFHCVSGANAWASAYALSMAMWSNREIVIDLCCIVQNVWLLVVIVCQVLHPNAMGSIYFLLFIFDRQVDFPVGGNFQVWGWVSSLEQVLKRVVVKTWLDSTHIEATLSN